MSSKGIPFHIDVSRVIDLLAKQIYQDPMALLRENCQNAFDAILLRRHLGHQFNGRIDVTIEAGQIIVSDNGIGMTRDEMISHYWTAGSSGKNNADARSAGVVGTFGIGAMANFGIARELVVTSESARTPGRTTAVAVREKLSAIKDCITIEDVPPTGAPGTTVKVIVAEKEVVDVGRAVNYLRDFVQYVDLDVHVNGTLVSRRKPLADLAPPVGGVAETHENAKIGPSFEARVDWRTSRNGEVWMHVSNVRHRGAEIQAELILKQNGHQLRAFRSWFGLANASVSSAYSFGGLVNSGALQPTAGREALTTESLQLLQALVTEIEEFVSVKIASTTVANQNTSFMEWVRRRGRYDLLDNLEITQEPENRSVKLSELKAHSKDGPIRYYQGNDASIVEQHASDESPVVVISRTAPRRNCELGYIQQFCRGEQITDVPVVTQLRKESQWSLAESALAWRVGSIVQDDYFVPVRIGYGKIVPPVPLLVSGSEPTQITLNPESSTIKTMLQLYNTEPGSLTGMAKDFVRTMIFPRIQDRVPSSTRQGAEAFLKAIRRPKDIFEYEFGDLGSLTEVWEEYRQGRISLKEATDRSVNITSQIVQVVDKAGTRPASDVIPDVLANERVLQQESPDLGPMPAITRLDVESNAKLLTIEDSEPAVRGFRAFLAISDRVRTEEGTFFLQPHRTEIVWGGQKILFVFQHHSGEFGLYYELMAKDLLAETPGGRSFPTTTIVIKNQVYIPIPEELRVRFLPEGNLRKRFEVRCELLYPDLTSRSKEQETKAAAVAP